MELTLNKFEEINHLPLKVFNRVVFLNNLYSDSGREAAEKYISLFSEAEKKQMYVMGSYIKRVGEELVRKEVTKGLVIVDKDYQRDV